VEIWKVFKCLHKEERFLEEEIFSTNIKESNIGEVM
jgi:hypothetical protein